MSRSASAVMMRRGMLPMQITQLAIALIDKLSVQVAFHG